MIIEFVVNGQAGIRLSDALKGNWAGLEDRDNRSLFKGSGPQISLRVLVSLFTGIHRRRR